jgi:Tfp pilus assembly protein PilF
MLISLRRILHGIAAAFAIVLVLVSSVPAQDTTWKGNGRIVGVVTDEKGQAIKDAVVKVVHAGAKAGPGTKKTDKNGGFVFTNIARGAWRIEVTAEGYDPGRSRMVVPDAGEGPRVTVKLFSVADLHRLMAAANELFKQGKFAEARAEFEKVLAARPDELRIHQSIGFTYGREGNHAEALKHLDLAAGAPSGLDTMTLVLAASSATATNDPARALGYLEKIDDVTLTEPDLLLNAALGLINKGHHDAGGQVLDRVIARFPESPSAYFFRGLVRLQAQQNAEAKADLEKFVSLASPELPQVKQARDLLSKINKEQDTGGRR